MVTQSVAQSGSHSLPRHGTGCADMRSRIANHVSQPSVEQFTPDEARAIAPFFTNTDRRIFALRELAFRYDAVTVVTNPNGRPIVELIKGYWTESKFRKKQWSESF